VTAVERRSSPTFPKIPGGYRVLIFAILASALTGPGQTTGVSVFTDHFSTDLNLTRSEVSLAYLIGTLTGALLLPRVGRFIDAKGVRLAQIIVGCAFGLALINMSLVNSFVWLAVGFTGIRFLGQGSLSLISTVTVSIWYRERRGTILGVYSTVTSAFNSLIPVALALIIAWVGWRQAWIVAAAIVVGVVVPMAVFGLRDLPQTSAETDPRPWRDAADVGSTAPSIDRAGALRTRAFWVLVAAASSASMLSTALNFHQIDLLGNVGFTKEQAAALFIPQVIGSTLAGLSIGWASDRLGTRYLPAAVMALLVASLLLAALISGPGLIAIVYAITLGAVGGGVRTATASLLPAWFGTGHLGSIQGALTFFNVAASALGPLALAAIEAHYDSYRPAVLLLSLIPTAAMLFALAPMKIPSVR
jgi:MFS family permease